MIGIVLLAHDQLQRASQVALHLADNGCAVVLHVDNKAKSDRMRRMSKRLNSHPMIRFAPRVSCEWGTFSLVEASLGAIRLMLREWPDVTHICQISGSCLPIRPVADLIGFLTEHPGTDFIESVPLAKDPWVVGGLSHERFTLYHPFSWRRQRRLFDLSVDIQRRLGVRRKMPKGLEPCIGSQWWCLSRQTIDRILNDPQIDQYNSYFRTTWIPDESYFQTLVRRHGENIVAKPLTFARFDPQGKPFHFYDDHLDLLLGMDAFFARKIWWAANKLYDTFLGNDVAQLQPPLRKPEQVMKRLTRAQNLRVRGRYGLLGQARYPIGKKIGARFQTARPYTVFDGFDGIFPELNRVLNSDERMVAHGHLLAADRIEFAGGKNVFTGNLTDSVKIRDYRPEQFLINLIWSERRRAQVFHHRFAPLSHMGQFVLNDPHAQIIRLKEAWVLDLIPAFIRNRAGIEELCVSRLAEEEACRTAFGAAQADVLEVSLTDLIQRNRAAVARIADTMPPYIDLAAGLAAPTLPNEFADLLTMLEQFPDVPQDLPAVTRVVRKYGRVTSALARKT